MTDRASPLILASRSAIRAELLTRAGLLVEIRPATLDERELERGLSDAGPAAVARHLAEAKALDVSARAPQRLVIGADQTLALGLERFTKPSDRAQARASLRRLSGRRHTLHSGFAIAADGAVVAAGVETAHLTMRTLSDESIDSYLDRAGDAVLSSVGCYQLEGLGVTLFERIDGDFFTILGLPLLPLLAALRAAGALEE
jgi:septum formation protein